MTNWQDPQTLFLSARAFVLCTHLAFGVFIWDWATSLWFDWQVLTGKRRLSFPAIVYLLARYTTLAALTVGLVITNAMNPNIDCESWNYALQTLAYTAVALTSLLLMLRVFAVSRRNLYIMIFFSTLYVADWGTIIYGIVHSSAVYIPELFLCAATNLKRHRPNTIVQFSFDLSCLATMTYFLLRSGSRGGSLWSFIVNQGIIYFIVISVGYLLAIVFLVLDLNDAITQIPNVFALTVMVIFSQRMQRDLSEFYAGSTHGGTTASGSAPPAGSGAVLPRFNASRRKDSAVHTSRGIHIVQSTVVHTDREDADKDDDDMFPMSKMDGSTADIQSFQTQNDKPNS
ncbi:hypothetical protein EXIGLDRAFT_843769 [Exidia glandulosa HHB12029]|uniref:Uncharacterized protein n=1 Tax=Exidia glandulosa HHB12029 TaxID=1314781 RepID=A0A165CGN8_EXIGL|nr:hypothetical protein EXIGLDRAFT_843769 [Exidia glandulosa HHB12029]